jgi:hypothetical protein
MGDAVVALPGRTVPSSPTGRDGYERYSLELTTFVLLIKPVQAGRVDAPRDLMNLVLSFRARDFVERLPGLEEAARKQALLRGIEPGLGCAIGFGSRALGDTDIGLERSNEGWVRKLVG